MKRQNKFGAVGVTALCVVSMLMWLSMVGLPYEVALIGKQYALNDSLAGAVASLELLALATVVAFGSRPFAGHDKSRVAVVGVALAIGATIGSMGANSLVMLMLCRVVFGAGLGLITISCNALPAFHPKPERLYAYMQLTVGVLFVVLMYGQPFVDRMVPKSGLFATQLGCLLFFGPFAFFLPRVKAAVSDGGRVKGTIGLPLAFMLAGVLAFCIVLGGAWSFTDQAGSALHLSADVLTWSLTGSALLNNLGPLTAAWIGVRFGYAWPNSLGAAAIGLCAILIYSSGLVPAYIAGILLLNAVGSFLNPYALGLLAEHDDTGVSSSLGAASMNFGLGAGPLLGGILIHSLGRDGFGLSLMAFSLASMILMLGTVVYLKRGLKLLASRTPSTSAAALAPEA